MKEQLEEKILKLIDTSVGLGQKGLDTFVEKFPDVFGGYINFILAARFAGILMAIGGLIGSILLLKLCVKYANKGHEGAVPCGIFSGFGGLVSLVSILFWGYDLLHAWFSPITFVYFEFVR